MNDDTSNITQTVCHSLWTNMINQIFTIEKKILDWSILFLFFRYRNYKNSYQI